MAPLLKQDSPFWRSAWTQAGHPDFVPVDPCPCPGIGGLVAIGERYQGERGNNALWNCTWGIAYPAVRRHWHDRRCTFHRRLPFTGRVSSPPGTLGKFGPRFLVAAFWMRVGVVGLLTGTFRSLAVITWRMNTPPGSYAKP